MTMIREAFRAHSDVIRGLDALVPDIERLSAAMIRSLRRGGKICWMGNGGSAADSQHLAAEFVGRFKKERHGLASIAFTTDSSILTAVSNDYGYDAVFVRQVEALCKSEDVVIGISTSGNSPNVVAAVRAAQRIGAFTAGFLGRGGGQLAAIADLSLVVPSDDTARIQEAHILIGHILCELVEERVELEATVNGNHI